MEFPNMERQWTKKVTKYEILKYLIQYRKQWFNHVTYLWGEPFIQWVFWDALKLWKKLGFTILVTTNATTIHLQREAEKYLPYINELILSIEAIDSDLQQKISRSKVVVHWDKVFENINLYWKGSYLKANIVITNDNLHELLNIVTYIHQKWMHNIAITYPDINLSYYWKEHLKKSVTPTYSDAIIEIIKVNNYCEEHNINLKIVDFPFCIFPKNQMETYIKKTDEFDYWNRLKVWTDLYEGADPTSNVIDRNDTIPRERKQIDTCNNCKYSDMCWWPSLDYGVLYWYNEIKNIEHE